MYLSVISDQLTLKSKVSIDINYYFQFNAASKLNEKKMHKITDNARPLFGLIFALLMQLSRFPHTNVKIRFPASKL